MDICIHLTDSQSQSLVVSLFLLRREQEIGVYYVFYVCVKTQFRTILSQTDFNSSTWYLPRAGWVLELVKGFQCATSEGKTARTTTVYTVLLLLSQVS